MKISKILYAIVLISNCGLFFVTASRCDRTPEGSSAAKSPPDGRYRLKIHNDPIRYIPRETYNISLEGISRFGQIAPHKFTGFYITVERDKSDNRHTGTRVDDNSVGTFHISESATAKFSEKCQNLVTHTSSFPKNEVLISWTAPDNGTGCVVFKSTVIEHRDVWFSDDGALSKILCKDEADFGDLQPQVLESCTACDEAKYELTFEGLWSRHTHPKDFPDNGWLTKFSDVIGASHDKDLTIWTYGEPASEGLKQLAEDGSTGPLERELKDEGEHIRTIIKARGISYPNVTGKTFAVFRVDSNHHLVSLVSMIYPSPDWFVGVSGLELCLANGSWIEEKILNLYPYDAGTDSGPTYISSDQPTNPREAIRRIKPNQPNDPRSPFHDPDNKEMKPLARLYVNRQRLYERSCRTQYQDPILEQDNDQYAIPSVNSQGSELDCDTTEWVPGECSKACGKGDAILTREYRIRKNQRRCEEANLVELEKKVECEVQSCAGDISEEAQPDKKTHAFCQMAKPVTSHCSAACGEGQKIQVTYPIPMKDDDSLKKLIILYNKLKTRNYHYKKSDDFELAEEISDTGSVCYGKKLIKREKCRARMCKHNIESMPVYCTIKPPKYNCRKMTPENRWYYKEESDECGIYIHTGCEDSDNIFESEEKCMKTCATRRNNDLKSYGLVSELSEKIDCKVTHWKHVPCNATCGDGFKWKFKSIIQYPQNGGFPCPKTLSHRERCYSDCGDENEEAIPQSFNSVNPDIHIHQCKYSNWSAWSPCSKSCGDSAVQIRTRTVLKHLNSHICNERLEERKCEVLPCLVGTGYNYNYNYRF